MKRLIVALLTGGLVFGAVFGLAAALDVDGGVLQAGGDTDLKCDPDGVDIDWQGVHWDNAFDAYVLDTVVVTDIHTDCNGQFIEVTLTDSDGFKIASGSHASITGTTESIGVGGTVKAEDVADVHVVIR